MHDASLLRDLLVLVTVGVVAATVLARLRLPVVAGLLFAGAIAGPTGLALISEAEAIERIAEVGVILLMFTIGMEFSGERLRRLGRIAVIGGTLQVVLTVLAVMFVAMWLGNAGPTALFYGFVVSLSSTAIVLRIYTERGQLDSPHGRFVIATLLYQDIVVVLMMLSTPLLAESGNTEQLWREIGLITLKAAVLIGMTFFAARYLIHHVYRWIDNAKSRELFILATLAIGIGTAWASSLAGLSLALGAFLAGFVIASSDFAHRALGEILPLREVLTSLFFISLGMLFDWNAVIEHPIAVGLLFLAFVVGKGLIASIAALAAGFPARVGWLAGVALAQFGEFGFVLVKAGEEAGLVDSAQLSPLLAAGVLSMFCTPLLLRLAPKVHGPEVLLRPLERLATHHDHADHGEHRQEDHVVIAGYGPAGKLLAEVLKANGVAYAIIDLGADRVRSLRRQGEPIHYGDITQPETVAHLGIDKARAVVVMFNDPEGVPRALDTLRRHAPGVPVLTRARYIGEAKTLRRLGADLIVVEEIETGLSMLRRVLEHLGFDADEARQHVRQTRAALEEAAS